MNINFKKNIDHNYMVIEKVKDFKENNFKVQMLLNNRIAGLLKFNYEIINGDINFLYDVSSRLAFSTAFEKTKMSFDNIRVLLLSIKNLIHILDEYLLDPDDVIMKKECIFLDSKGYVFEFCYFPFYNGNMSLELRELFGNILQIVDYEDECAVRLAYELFEKTQSASFTISDLIEVLNEDAYSGFSTMNLNEEQSIDETETYPVVLESRIPEIYQEKGERQSIFTQLSLYLKDRGFLDVLEDINNGEFMDRVREYGFSNDEFSYQKIMENYSVETVKEESVYDLGIEFYEFGRDDFKKNNG